ncbi:ATP-dependent zinc metalloprotease FtsH [bacterium]|nr:ATP-dependent zinc metalloprotease FtsH [bacterium]MCI0566079.1 ATP-dependent zinc metalloprotease FtsH [bacterium]
MKKPLFGDGKKKEKKEDPEDKSGQGLASNAASIIFIFFFLAVAYMLFSGGQEKTEEMALSELAEKIKSGQVEKISVEGDDLIITLEGEEKRKSKKEVETALSETLANYGVDPEELAAVETEIKNPTSVSYWLLNILPFLLPIVFIVLFFWLISRQVKGAGMQAFTFGQSKARFIDPKDKNQRVTFKDVAGVKEAKEELTEIVEFLKNPKKFHDIGARIPKGVILMGAPGTGKTLVARAVAGEAGVPFFHLSGSEFVEMFVGVGASRVRDLFKLAKKTSPAIIFVDEIDAVGRVRGTGIGGGNDEREQTLNQILVEMDGFEPNEKIIVMAATNRPDVLDPALMRPGRFDRRIILELPDIADREAILKIHARKKPLAENVNLKVVAQRTPGFSGADLYSLMNEGAILAARNDRKQILQDDLLRSIEKVLLGPERKSKLLSLDEKKITAYHEAGHAVVSSALPYADPVHKISIVSRGHAAGYTLKLPDEEKRFQSKREFLDNIASMLGGYAAERMIFDDLTTGPSNDIQVASALARDMVTKYGMSDTIGPVAFERMAGRSPMGATFEEFDYSEDVAALIDREVSAVMKTQMKRAEEVLLEHKSALHAVATKLREVETIEREEYEKILEAEGIKINKNKDAEKTPPEDNK